MYKRQGYIASISGSVTSYLNLRDINKELLERNGQLELQMLDLQDQLDALIADTVSFKGFAPDSTEQFPYSFVVADVVNNSVTHLSNYITVDKGKLDGIMPDMGVVSERGVVGIVSTVSDHFSVIIPLLNPKFRLSCKVLGLSLIHIFLIRSILGGRVKTLHPKVFGGILARRENENDQKQLAEYEIPEIDLVIVDLYPFEETVASGAEEQAIIEKIDIGGISLIRAAAKNFKDVVIVASKAQYQPLMDLLNEKGAETSIEDRSCLLYTSRCV